MSEEDALKNVVDWLWKAHREVVPASPDDHVCLDVFVKQKSVFFLKIMSNKSLV